jgi:hypothetical protein
VHVSVVSDSTPAKSPTHWHVQFPPVDVLFAGHCEHSFCLSDASNVPAAHSVQLAASLGIPDPVWYFPCPQSTHAADEIWPGSSWYLPAPHSVQLDSRGIPDPVWYLPAPHSEQLDASCIPDPVWYEPGTHSEHSATAGTPLPVW